MQATWQANVQTMLGIVQQRGWTVSEAPVPPLGLSAKELEALEATLGLPIPPQLRHALAWAGQWQFGWYSSPLDEPPSKLSACAGGSLSWNAQQLEEENLHEAMLEWVACQNEDLQDVEDAAFLQAHTALWQAHFPFAVMPNGDLLTIDTRNPDPQRQPVRYWFHDLDGDSTDGALMAPNFFSFISGWTALGCVGSEYWTWAPLMRNGAFEVQGELAREWFAWLVQDVNAVPAAERRPKRVAARTQADHALLLAAQAGNLAAVREALAQGAHPDAEDMEDVLHPNMYAGFSKGDTALVLAARHNRLDMVQALLDGGASLATYDLPLARLMGHAGQPGYASAQTLHWLIGRGARIDPWPGESGNSALHNLIDNQNALGAQNYLMLLDALLDAGCNPDVFQEERREYVVWHTTALMRTGVPSQKRLLAAGANPHLRDRNGMTAMHHIRWPQQVALLAAHGLDINDLSQPENPLEATRPLHWALDNHWREDPAQLCALLQAMLEQGADPSLPDGQGHDAWRYCRHAECAQLLRNNPAKGHIPP